MTGIEHRATRGGAATIVRRGAGLGLLLGALLCLVGVPVVVAGSVSFTPVTGSPFRVIPSVGIPEQVVFSPSGGLLATLAGGLDLQTVSTAGVVAAPVLAAAPPACPVRHKPTLGTDLDSVAFSSDGALLALAGESGGGRGNLRTYSVSGAKLTADACLTFGRLLNAGTGTPEYSVAFSPSAEGRLLALADGFRNTVSVFSVSAAGKVTELSGSPFATGKGPRAVTFSASGPGFGLLATANVGNSTVSVFSVSGGVVAPVPGSPFKTGKNPSSLAFSPDRGLLATADEGSNSVSVFSVDYVGKLTPVSGSPFATGSYPRSVALSPDGTLLATADSGSNKVSVFSVSGAGKLSQLPSSPFVSSPTGYKGPGPDSLAFSPRDSLLATANSAASTTSVFAGAPTGSTTVVTITANAPRAYTFTLSTATQPKVVSDMPATELTVPSGQVTFNVTDSPGAILSHTFEVCATPLPGPVRTLAAIQALPNSCSGTTVPPSPKVLGPGQSVTGTIDLTSPGTYEYLSTVGGAATGDASAGMKGVLNVTQ